MSWLHTFDFSDNNGGWAAVPNSLTPHDLSTWQPGQGWVGYYQPEYGDDCANQIRITFPKATITSMTLLVINAGSCSPYGCACSLADGLGAEIVNWNPVSQGSQTFNWTGSVTTKGLDIGQYNSGTTPGTIVSLTIRGIDSNPFSHEEADCSIGVNGGSQAFGSD